MLKDAGLAFIEAHICREAGLCFNDRGSPVLVGISFSDVAGPSNAPRIIERKTLLGFVILLSHAPSHG